MYALLDVADQWAGRGLPNSLSARFAMCRKSRSAGAGFVVYQPRLLGKPVLRRGLLGEVSDVLAQNRFNSLVVISVTRTAASLRLLYFFDVEDSPTWDGHHANNSDTAWPR
jgi:hypothetical protein